MVDFEDGQEALRWTGDKVVTRMPEDRQVKKGETGRLNVDKLIGGGQTL